MGLAVHNYESSNGTMPSVGQCESGNTTTYTVHGWSVLILPYIEQDNVYKLFDTNYNHYADSNYRNATLHPTKSKGRAYDDPAHPSGFAAAQTKIKTYVCPSTPIGNDSRDPEHQLGGIDYMAASLSDIITDPANGTLGTRGGVADRVQGAMNCEGRTIIGIADGSSNTFLLLEDAGRAHPSVATFGAGSTRFSAMNSPSPAISLPASGARRVFAWADPDAATNGVSGPSLAGGDKTAKINNYASPIGGGTGCPWSTNNCGPNDEPFSFHSGGINVVMADGSVRFIRDSIHYTALKFTVGSSDGQTVTLD
jgi:prepilin-type processing-associated H-X9-DG protein